MTLETLLHRYATYNHWANKRIADWLQSAPDSVFNQPVVSSFPSIRDTIKHIFGAEWLWLQRLNGVSPTFFDIVADDWSNRRLLSDWVTNAANFRDEICSKKAAFFGQTCQYKLLSGREMESIRAEMIQHCIQHSTFHRGQIVTMARQLGLTDIPATDFIQFTREVGMEL